MAGGKNNIVIVGGGFAGVRAALDLCALLGDLPKHRIVLIDRNTYHLYTPWMYEHAATATVSRKLLKFPYSAIFRNKPVEVIRGEVEKIDRHTKKISLKSKQIIPYDILIMACGSVTNDFGIPGVKRHGLLLKTIEDAERIRTTIRERFLRFLEGHKEGKVFQVLVGGGGVTGSEFTAQLHSYLKDIARTVAHDEGTFLIKIVESSPKLLGGMSDWESRQAQERIGSYRRIEILLQHRIARVNAASISIANGDSLTYDVFIWTGGIQANPLVTTADLVTTKKGRAEVNMSLQSVCDPSVFVIGDSASCINPETHEQSRETVESAYKQGVLAAANTWRLLTKRELLAFDHKLTGNLIPLKSNWAISTLFGIRLQGLLAYWLVRVVNLRYLLWILPTKDAINRWLS
ncbi:MAG: FAD-dependent oxidoreductase [Candidatus Saccharibacteria bacterium]|nr:FAD-dependent oxidoreductase [Candidatus Saccharibacteria bacterium]